MFRVDVKVLRICYVSFMHVGDVHGVNNDNEMFHTVLRHAVGLPTLLNDINN